MTAQIPLPIKVRGATSYRYSENVGNPNPPNGIVAVFFLCHTNIVPQWSKIRLGYCVEMRIWRTLKLRFPSDKVIEPSTIWIGNPEHHVGSKAGPAPNGGNPTPPKWYRKQQSLNDKRKALGMAASINRQTDAYLTNPAGEAPWE